MCDTVTPMNPFAPSPLPPVPRVVGGRRIGTSEIRRILIRGTNWVGDAVMTLPALDAVREIFPRSVVTVLAKPWVAPVYRYHPGVDRVIVFDKGNGGWGGLKELIRCSRQIRKEAFDLAILFQNAFEAALLAFLGRVGARVGYGTDGRGLLLTHRVVREKAVLRVHQTEYYLSLLRGMGWKGPSRAPVLSLPRQIAETADAFLRNEDVSSRDFLLGLGPGAMYGGAKRWPAERFAEIGDLARRMWGAKVLLFGSTHEREVCRRVRKGMKGHALDLSGRTSLEEAMGLIERCAFFVSNDSGLMHIASVLGVPTVAVFGPTDPVTTGPMGPHTRIVRHDTSCAPCLKPECREDHACMLGIRPADVWEAMTSLREEIRR